MRVFGLAVSIKNGSPIVRVALVDADCTEELVFDSTSANVETVFEVPAGQGDIATQLELVATAVSSRIQSLQPDFVAVRAADHSPQARQTSGPRLRLMTEGAITSAARHLVSRTSIRTGKEWGVAFGSNKATVDSAAGEITDRKFVEAVAPALGILAECSRQRGA